MCSDVRLSLMSLLRSKGLLLWHAEIDTHRPSLSPAKHVTSMSATLLIRIQGAAEGHGLTPTAKMAG